ncbi:MAG: hypothetical protein QW688_04540 [Thermoprotei archaeon]
MRSKRILAGCAGGLCFALGLVALLSTTILIRRACFGPPSTYICPTNGVPYISQGWALTLTEPLVISLIIVLGHLFEHRHTGEHSEGASIGLPNTVGVTQTSQWGEPVGLVNKE